MNRLELVGELIASKARDLVPIGTSRPAYKGQKPWTARYVGELRHSIRVVRLDGDPRRNIRVYAGARQSDKLTAYYALFVERGTIHMAAKPFLRPALNSSKSEAANILLNGA